MSGAARQTPTSDTWADDWEPRLRRHLQSLGYSDAWQYVAAYPGTPYVDLAEETARAGGFGVAAVQLQALQAQDTPDADLDGSLRDSLARLLRGGFRRVGWGQGSYWRGYVGGAFADWSVMWQKRRDLCDALSKLLALSPPEGWVPKDGDDPVLVAFVGALE